MLAAARAGPRGCRLAPEVQTGVPMRGKNALRWGEGAVDHSAPGTPESGGPGGPAAPRGMGVSTDERVIAVEAVFDIAAALRARDGLARLAPGTRVCVDLSRVGESHDAAFAVLADGIARLDRVTVRFRGLTERQRRMLRYFGIAGGEER